MNFENSCVFLEHAANIENDAGTIRKSGKPSFYIGGDILSVK
jgi:hypothetical protein